MLTKDELQARAIDATDRALRAEREADRLMTPASIAAANAASDAMVRARNEYDRAIFAVELRA